MDMTSMQFWSILRCSSSPPSCNKTKMHNVIQFTLSSRQSQSTIRRNPKADQFEQAVQFLLGFTDLPWLVPRL